MTAKILLRNLKDRWLLAIINTTACISTSLLYAIACILHIVDAHGKNGKHKKSFTEASKNLATKQI